MGTVPEDPHRPPPPGADSGPPGGETPSGNRPWPERLTSAAEPAARWLMRPRVRLTVIGVSLLVIGGLVISNSVWTLPLVVVGAVMVVVAWVGHRLEGRLTVQWGEAGTELAFRATVKPAEDASAPQPAISPAPAEAELSPGRDEVIEGEAHTVEIDVADLKALIAAAESADREAASAAAAPADIRIRRTAQGA